MRQIVGTTACLTLLCAFATSLWAAAAQPEIATADWSVKSPHSLASNPPPADAVWAFVNSAFGGGDLKEGKLCQFHFADLRNSGNLSLVVVLDGGGMGGCNLTYIFDKTASGFEDYFTRASPEDNLPDSFQDISHDGKLELILYAPLAPYESRHFGCDAEWPVVFAWTGRSYTDVSIQYKKYYEHYLDSLKKQITAAAAFPTSMPDPDFECKRIEAAKAEAFLGISSGVAMSDAIKASVSKSPDERAMAAVFLSYIGTPKAMAELWKLSSDSNPAVADIGNERLSYEEQDPDEDYRQMTEDR